MREVDRRGFVLAVSTMALGAAGAAAAAPARWDDEEGVTAPEDLMKEHGVLSRCLLLYEALLQKMDRQETVYPVLFHETADVVHEFVERYHERNEELYVFPVFRRAGRLTPLVDTLVAQHRAGRRLTEQVLALSTPAAFVQSENQKKVAEACRAFIKMYRPHAAREDTVLFPALRTVLPPAQVLALGQKMEAEEGRILGEKGFERTLDRIVSLEKQLGIHELGYEPDGDVSTSICSGAGSGP